MCGACQGLVDFIKEQVPEPEWDSTPVWLKATAGLRLLPAEEQDAIMTSVRAFLASTPFIFRPGYARVISGSEVRPTPPPPLQWLNLTCGCVAA